jgi:methionyl-tRNA synthetase
MVKKMGKSLGNTLDPFELVEKYGSDAVRYYFLKEIECGKDGDFNETRFVNILNADLANDLGNLLNRTLGMTQKYCQGLLPPITAADLPQEHPLKTIGLTLGEKVIKAYEQLKFNEGCEEILSLVRAGNKFIDEQAPWSVFKEGKQAEVEKILYGVLESVRLAAYLLAPIIPNLSGKIYQQLGFSVDFNQGDRLNKAVPFEQHSEWGKLTVNQPLAKPQPIFAKLDLPPEDNP